MTVMDFLKKVVWPISAAAFFAALFYPICVENGVCDYLKLWVFTGIPFGVQRMYFWIVPKGYDLGATVAIFVLNLLVGGVIGGVVLVWRLLIALCFMVKALVSGIVWAVGKVAEVAGR
ncbi:DUF6050 family protein [Blautia schinkii]|nr:DUF6050 family protein [Blautia schinkii]